MGCVLHLPFRLPPIPRGNSTYTVQYPAVHLSASDVSVDSAINPRAVIIRIKASKIDPLHSGINIYVGKTDDTLCPVAALLAYILVRGVSPGPLFMYEGGIPLTRDALVKELREALSRSTQLRIRVTASESGQPLQQRLLKFRMPSSRHSGGGRAQPINFTSSYQRIP